MANTLLTIGMITNEALAVLENELTFTSKINRQYDDQFAKTGAKIGSTINIRKPVRYVGRRVATLNTEDSTETQVPLTLDTQYGTDMEFTSKELTLDIDSFSDRFIKPAVATISNMIDYDGLQKYKDVYNAVGTPGTTPNSLSTYLDAGVKLDNESVPAAGRCVCLNPQAQATIVNALTGLFNPNKQVSDQYLKGSMGSAVGFDWYMDQNVATHTGGTYSANVSSNAVKVNGAVSSGSSVALDGWTSGDALKAGDIITFDTVYAVNPQNRQSTGQLRQFTVAADATANGSGQMTVTVSPSLVFSGKDQTVTSASNTLPDNDPIDTFFASAAVSPQNLAFTRDSFVFGTAQLEKMPGVENAIATSKKLGMSIRIINSYDATNDKKITRLDLLGGWGTLREEQACRIAG